jgi:c(7)-type cytochrome triheme protein
MNLFWKGGEEMRITVLLSTLVISIVFLVGSAMAVPPGKTVVFKNAAMGDVTFDGKIHADKGFKCNDCHTKIFPMKQTTLTMAAMKDGKECGTCHNGEKAFSVKADCMKCHKK